MGLAQRNLEWSSKGIRETIRQVRDSKVHGANMGPTWVLSAPDGLHADPMNFAIWEVRDTVHLL